jgi:hypothetical protein
MRCEYKNPDLIYRHIIETNNAPRLEDLLHRCFSEERIDPRREWFSLSEGTLREMEEISVVLV